MSRIATVFHQLRAQGRKALIPYITLGFPERESALELVPALVEAGADLVELGVPFSDPLADGATIQAASQRALANGMTPDLALEQITQLRARGLTVPFIWMGYYNPILQMGLEVFAQRAAEAGVDGVIVPDLPPEEADALQQALQVRGMDLIFLLAPTSDEERIREVTRRSTGFIYLVSVTGVTGAREHLPPDLPDLVRRVRRHTDLPLAVGFGISRPEHAAAVGRLADGVIVGSALLRAIPSSSSAPDTARAFLQSLREALDAPST